MFTGEGGLAATSFKTEGPIDKFITDMNLSKRLNLVVDASTNR
jgi:hypothetical protein